MYSTFSIRSFNHFDVSSKDFNVPTQCLLHLLARVRFDFEDCARDRRTKALWLPEISMANLLQLHSTLQLLPRFVYMQSHFVNQKVRILGSIFIEQSWTYIRAYF